MSLKLHNFFRSSTSTRVRVALNLKGLDYEYLSYQLKDGATRTPEFLARNPAGLVPVLELEDGSHLNQSLAIIEWLDETHPEPPLLPPDPLGRARVRALACMIACEIHPLNNLRVLQHLKTQFNADEAGQAAWFVHWVRQTFDALEVTLAGSPETGRFCHGDMPGLADICLFAQLWNNTRFGIDQSDWPTIARIGRALEEEDHFTKAAPPMQPDAA